jgi:hypothetical protein
MNDVVSHAAEPIWTSPIGKVTARKYARGG